MEVFGDKPKNAEKSPVEKACKIDSLATFVTLIPEDTTLISATNASKTVLAKLRQAIPKQDATPQPHGCGVKGEPNRKHARIQNDTMYRQQKATHTKIYERFSPNAKQIPPNGPTCHAVWRMARLES